MKSRSPYALSTAWNYRDHQCAKGIADEIKSLGFDSAELNFALTETQVDEFTKLAKTGYINITSTHNYCPLPDGVDPKHASPEYYSLTSPDKDERSLAIKFTQKSMDFAKKLGAKALILHLGRVDIKDKTKRLFVTSDKMKFEKMKKAVLIEREAKAKKFLDCGLRSIETLLKHAENIELKIALENRYYIKEMPSLGEFKIIFNSFTSPYLCYWHDTGHAQIYENLSILKHEDYLDLLSNRLIGIHLHDIILFDDHRAPGTGEFDFKRLNPYIEKETIKVLEVHKKSTPQELKKASIYLQKALKP